MAEHWVRLKKVKPQMDGRCWKVWYEAWALKKNKSWLLFVAVVVHFLDENQRYTRAVNGIGLESMMCKCKLADYANQRRP